MDPVSLWSRFRRWQKTRLLQRIDREEQRLMAEALNQRELYESIVNDECRDLLAQMTPEDVEAFQQTKALYCSMFERNIRTAARIARARVKAQYAD